MESKAVQSVLSADWSTKIDVIYAIGQKNFTQQDLKYLHLTLFNQRPNSTRAHMFYSLVDSIYNRNYEVTVAKRQELKAKQINQGLKYTR